MKFKKSITILLSAALLLPLSAFASSNKAVGYWAAGDILYLKEKSITQEETIYSFEPERSATRAEAATLLAKAFGLTDQAKSTESFSDLSKEHWASDYIQTLSEKEMIAGYPDGSFRPEDPITREELAVIASGFLANPPVTTKETPAFNDISGSYAKNNINRLVDANVIAGYPDGSFRPEAKITKAEIASVITRLNKVESKQLSEEEILANPFFKAPIIEQAPEATPAPKAQEEAAVTDANGAPVSYKKKLTMKATAYTPDPRENGGYTTTAIGTPLKKGVVAVDPKVIPLRTKLYIEGYGYARAEDTGGAIKGNRIDLLFLTKSEMRKFGRQDVTVYILND